MVGTDTKPEAYVGKNLFSMWYQENTAEFWVILFLGIIIGFILSWLWRGFMNYLESNDEKNEENREIQNDNESDD